MAVGGCFCGKIRIEYTGQPLMSALCHCLDCRKLTGSPYTYSYVVKSAELNVTGKPKEVPKTADSGSDIKNYFCPDCGTPLFGGKVKSDGTPEEVTILRAGIFDDSGILNERKPEAEIYTDRRLAWVEPIEGAAQFSGMPSL
ncbi:hypothetical protein BO94DRAFT_623756 [Aspergillus sclerotioniger CBS 115572]|uniref:CENP-V/GFA domain-containing protein n=1 Tax=Aspergillus sclerotioniger CBS 115572 TaxID=1450535 RepID=A0A317WQJ6_9EURO|nr:hypothetical protein BO94DRAFT_623756 [Aspergillus sclerotioniger CBS 115572]PWY88676.1 hypothetical protein BO94DRAFT_623756 [Aspergillus sclerotioniger CBS 115572]